MTVAKEINNGVALLLERMKTHPEEFVSEHGSSKWGSLIAAYKEFLDPKDQRALETEYHKILQQKFTEKVLVELVDPKSVMNPYLASPTAMPLGGQTQGQFTINNTGAVTGTISSNSITLGNTTLSEAGLRQMLATHKLMRVEEKAKRWWNKSIPELLGKK